jgi:hypothetical protein
LVLISSAPFPSSAGDKVVPSGGKFPFGFYSVGYGTGNPASCGGILQNLKRKGITVLGPFYGKEFDALKKNCYEAAADLQMDSIYYIPVVEQQSQQVASFLNPETALRLRHQGDISEQVEKQVEFVATNPALAKTVKWWGVMPEELRSWRREEMDYLSELVTAIRSAERRRNLPPRPVMMYEPSNRRANLLEVTGKYLDVQAIGTYTRDPSDVAVVNAIRTSIAALVQTSSRIGTYPVVTLALNRPYPPSVSPESINRLIRRNTYIALVEGAKGVLVWSWATRKGLSVADRDVQADAYASVANDLNGPMNLGEIFLRGNVIASDVSRSDAVLVRSLEHNGEIYSVLVNTGQSEERVVLKIPAGMKASALFPQDLSSTSGGLTLRLSSNGVAAVRFTK